MTRSRSLDNIVDITVEVSPLSAARSTFNQALFIGTTDNIDTTERLRLYEDSDSMLDDGFSNTDPEYIAAQIYFSQSPAPDKLWIGRQGIGESCLEALTECRGKNPEWYIAVCLDAVYADHVECAAYVESCTPASLYGFTTSDAECISSVESSPPDIFSYLKSLSYSRTFGQYATTQSDLYPNNIYAICAIIGYACGQNSGLVNSAFTLKFKKEVGISVEPLTVTEITALEGKNGNVYLYYANYYTIFEQGKMVDGSFFDEKINLDMLVNNMQLTIMDLLYQNPKVPQTDAGVTQLIHACNDACEEAVRIGFLGPGTWTGVNILNLSTDDPLPRGYLVQAESLATQSKADREARKSVPIYVAIKEAGAVHSIIVGIYVNR